MKKARALLVVKIGNVSISPPPDEWLDPCLLIECEVRSPPLQCIIDVKGLLLAEDGKIITELREIPFKSGLTAIDEVLASGNQSYNDYVRDTKYHKSKLNFVAPLSRYALDYIETLRQKSDPKPRGVTFKIKYLINYLDFKIETAHLHQIETGKLPPQLKTSLEQIDSSLIAYRYDDRYHTNYGPFPILAIQRAPIILFSYNFESEYSHKIPYEDWINKFLPKLNKYTVITIEIPTRTVPPYEHLTKAVKELKYGEKLLREGNYNGVIGSLRNIIINHLLTEKKEVEVQAHKEKQLFLNTELKKVIIANIPRDAERAYKAVLHGVQGILRRLLQDHLSKFIHIDTGKLIHMPLKADAEYLFLNVTSILKYLSCLCLLREDRPVQRSNKNVEGE